MIKALVLAVTCTAAIAAAASAVPAAAQSPRTHQHSFSGAQKWAQVFDDPQRDAWQKPHQVIEALELAPDSAVADIGSGTGYFSVRLAHFLPRGHVYGVDIEPDMVSYLAERAKREAPEIVTAVAGQPGDPRLPAKVDVVLMVDVYHHIEHRGEYFSLLQTYLKPGGRLAIVDFNGQSRMGPPVSARIAPAQVRAELEQAGYRLIRQPDFLPEQFFLIFATK
jgi:predicted methyltransferase